MRLIQTEMFQSRKPRPSKTAPNFAVGAGTDPATSPESMLREKESLREKLDAIESGTMMRFSEADIEFVMNRADCSREDAIKAIKKFSCSYPHLSIAIRWLNLPNKERMASMYPVE